MASYVQKKEKKGVKFEVFGFVLVLWDINQCKSFFNTC